MSQGVSIHTFVVGTIIDRYENADLGLRSALPTPMFGSCNAGVLDGAAITLQVSDDNVTYVAAVRGDTAAAVTALTGTNIPIALNRRYLKCTAGSGSIRPILAV